MSTRQTGNRHENTVCAEAEALGYAAFPSRGSRGPVDVICFVDENRFSRQGFWPPLVIQVGTTNKPIASTLAELSAAPRPIGSLCLVARRHRHKTSRRISWTWHSAAGKFATLAEALEARP